MGTLQKIQQRIIDRDYLMSSHAEEEMLNDSLERKDIENAIFKGCIENAVDAFLSKQHTVEERLSVEVVSFNQVAA